MVPLHLHALLSGVLPPFSSFLVAVLSHYEIHTLHLHPSSLVLLSAFVFLCEAFAGVTPSMALLRHFFSLVLVSEEQCYGCASLATADASAPRSLDTELLREAEGFRWQWVQVGAAEAGALFLPPLAHATPNRGWMREELTDPRLTLVLTRLEKLKRAGVTMVMVVREFVRRRIAPLQRHSCPMWAYAGPRDLMRIQVLPLPPHILRELLRRLAGDDPYEIPPNGLPLYEFKAPEALVAEMPLFDEWGFHPRVDACPREALGLGVDAHENSGRVAPPAARVDGASPPSPPTLAPSQVGVSGDGRPTAEVAALASKLQPRADGSPHQAPRIGRKRKSREGGRPSTRWAPVNRKWIVVDE
ncbi:hypothetical protein D1007_48478 [Hordeum vulgare]|nr:hypothetical protein D1007_48478 [Hordeum vulgare]